MQSSLHDNVEPFQCPIIAITMMVMALRTLNISDIAMLLSADAGA